MRRLPVYLSLLSVSCAYAQLSFNLNVGLSDVSFETEAALVIKYDEMNKVEAIDNYKNSHPYQTSVISALNDENSNGTLLLSHIFTKGSNAGKDWSGSTSNVHLLKYSKTDGEVDSSNVTTKRTKLTFIDIVLSSSPATAEPNNVDKVIATWLPPTADSATLKPLAGTVLMLEAKGNMDFEYQRPNKDTDVVTTEADQPIYTTASIPLLTSPLPTSGTATWDLQTDNAFKAHSYAVIMSTSEYEAMENLKNTLEQEQNTAGYNALYGEEHFDYLDLGMDAVYGYGDVSIFLSANAHYPLPLTSRSTTELIRFNPGATVDASFGALISYGQGKIGLSAGVAQVRGDYSLSPLQKSYSEFPKTAGAGTNTDGNSTSITLPAEYIDHNQSYTSGEVEKSIKDINEPLYFAEIKAESAPLYDGGMSVYGKFRVALSEDNSDVLKRLKITQDTVTVGASFNAFYM